MFFLAEKFRCRVRDGFWKNYIKTKNDIVGEGIALPFFKFIYKPQRAPNERPYEAIVNLYKTFQNKSAKQIHKLFI